MTDATTPEQPRTAAGRAHWSERVLPLVAIAAFLVWFLVVPLAFIARYGL